MSDKANSRIDDLVAQLKRNAAACAAIVKPPDLGSDPLYYMTGRAAAEIERLQAENARLREALVGIRRLAVEQGAHALAERVAQVLEQSQEK
jgi:hypothetical protein